MLEKKCLICKKKFLVKPYRYIPGKFCSRVCYGIFLKSYMRGNRNPWWRGGRNKSTWRQRALERDNYKCQRCGINDPRVLTVDHIKNKSLHKEDKFKIENGITLCANCHLIKTKKDKELKAIFKEVATKTIPKTLYKRYARL